MSLTERKILPAGAEKLEVFHSIELADYVSVIALDEKGRIPLVCQFRPAVESHTFELPGGLLDDGETQRIALRGNYSKKRA